MNHNRTILKQTENHNMLEPEPFSKSLDSMKRTFNGNKEKAEKDKGEPISILADRVFSYCQMRDSFLRHSVDLPDVKESYEYVESEFYQGAIKDGDITVTPLGIRRPNFSRVQFVLKIPFSLRLRNLSTKEVISVSGVLPDIEKDIVMFMPEARNEFKYKIDIETRTDLLDSPEITSGKVLLSAGIYEIIRVVGKVQLLVSSYDYIPEPPIVEPFGAYENDLKDEFETKPFPEDFFPAGFNEFEES
ncbi:MAG: hypothetical protein ACOYVK_02360 [Bacillota bacterium]